MPIAQKHFAQALYGSFPDPVVIIDSDWIILSANPAITKQFGYTPDEIANRPARILYATDEDYDAYLSRDARERAGEDVSDDVHQYRRKDGSVFSGRLRVTAVRGEDGTAQGFIGVVHDISDLLELDRARRKTAEMFDAALQAIPEGFAIFDSQEKLLPSTKPATIRPCRSARRRPRRGSKADCRIFANRAASRISFPTATGAGCRRKT
jgi:PAS domain S-box-containing protein